MLATIKLFEVLKTRFSDEDAKFVVEEIEKIEASVETKVEKIFDQKKDVLATKGDIAIVNEKIAIAKADMIKWMLIIWIGQLLTFIAIAKFIFHQ